MIGILAHTITIKGILACYYSLVSIFTIYNSKGDNTMAETKTCSHCNQPIEDENSLTFCASCHEPYHKECWGKCVCFYNCQGANETDTIIETATSFSNIDNTYDTELNNYIGANSEYYKDVFRKIKCDNRSKFNWSAGLFSGCWLFYRKLYKEGIIIWSSILIFTCIFMCVYEKIWDKILLKERLFGSREVWMEMLTTRSSMANIILWILVILVSVFIAFRGNELYFNKIEKLKKASKPYKRGGTSLLNAILCLAFVAIFSLVFETLVSDLNGFIKSGVVLVAERFFCPIVEFIREMINISL